MGMGCIAPEEAGIRRPLEKRLLSLVTAAAISVCLLAGFALPLLFRANRKAVAASPEGNGGKVVMVIIDRIGIDDLVDFIPDLPNISNLIENGSVSLMNARVRFGGYGPGNCLAIGAGGMVLSSRNAALAFDTNELLHTASGEYVVASEVYHTRTGYRPPPDSIVNLAIEELLEENDSYLASSTPGLLGESLGEQGLSVGLVGNADSLDLSGHVEFSTQAEPFEQPPSTPADLSSPTYPLVLEFNRESSCIAMDEEGVVANGTVSTRLFRENPEGNGLTTDFEALVAEAKRQMRDNDFTVIDMGQTSRLDSQSSFFSEPALWMARRKALMSCDEALGDILGSMDTSKDLLIVCSPTPSRQMIEDGELLVPLIISGPGFDSSSLVTSSSTRRPGLVSSYDIAPTVLDFLKVEIPGEMVGQSMESVASSDRLAELQGLKDKAVYFADARSPLVNVFVIPAALLLVLLMIVSLARIDLLQDHPLFWSVLLLALLACPFVYLLLPVLPIRSLPWTVVFTLFSEYALAGLLLLVLLRAARKRLRSRGDGSDTKEPDRRSRLAWAMPRAVLLVSSVLLAAILLDPFIGSPMVTLSPFGSSLVGAGRYYGIGNLYMGFAIGAALLVSCLAPSVFTRLLDKRWKVMVGAGAVLLATVFVLGFPKLGANVGALITGVVAALFALVKLGGRQIRWKQVLALVAIGIICIALLLVVDLVLPGSVSHAGKALERFSEEGMSGVVDVINRKASMDWKLFWSSNWRYFFFAAILASILWQARLGMYGALKEDYPFLRAAWVGMIAGIVAGILFNDTGIESASAIILFLVVPPLLLLLPRGRAGPVKAQSFNNSKSLE